MLEQRRTVRCARKRRSAAPRRERRRRARPRRSPRDRTSRPCPSRKAPAFRSAAAHRCAARSSSVPIRRSRSCARCWARSARAPSEIDATGEFGDDVTVLRAALRALGVAIERRAVRAAYRGQGLAGLQMAARGSSTAARSFATLALLAARCAPALRHAADAAIRRQALGHSSTSSARCARAARRSPRRCEARRGVGDRAAAARRARCSGSSARCPRPMPTPRARCCSRACSPTAPTTVVRAAAVGRSHRTHADRARRAAAPARLDGRLRPAEWTGRLPRSVAWRCRATPTLAAFVAAAASVIQGSRVALRDVGCESDAQRLLRCAAPARRALAGVIAKGDRAGREPIAELQVQSGARARRRDGRRDRAALRRQLAGAVPARRRARCAALQLVDGEAFAPAGDPFWSELAALRRARSASTCRPQPEPDSSVDAAPRLRAARASTRAKTIVWR